MELATRTHACMDYFIGLLLLAMPMFPGFESNRMAGLIVMLTGVFMLCYNLATNYELGIISFISVQSHLMLDFVAGVFLAFSPWLFGFADSLYVPFLLLGLYQIVVSFVTHIPLEE